MKKNIGVIFTLILAFVLLGGQIIQAQTASTESDQPTAKHPRSKHKKDSSDKAAAQGRVDVNSASKEELQALPGIGPALADKIIQNRPYKSKRELVSRSVIPESTYKDVKDQLVAHKGSEQNSSSSSTGANPPGAEKERSSSSAKSSSDESSKSESNSRQSEPATAQESTSDKSSTASETTTAQTPPEKGMVWVNLRTKIYHREGDRWYGKTKHGKFMSEADAVKEGYRAAKNGPKGEQNAKQ
jgi:helix-hairpin-helix protein